MSTVGEEFKLSRCKFYKALLWILQSATSTFFILLSDNVKFALEASDFIRFYESTLEY